tara:strand:+ start:5066 stop:6037 length:972 start_codon:yes stop_codon:yes gene_type:complete
MKINAENPSELISKARPNLKPNTVKQYQNTLTKLQSIFETDTYDFLDNPENVADKISHLHFTSQRNHYNAIIVLLMALNSDKKYTKIIDEYSDVRDKLNDMYIESNKDSTISSKQSKNFASMEEINKMIDTIGTELKQLKLKKKESLTKKEFSLLQFFVLVNLYSKMPLRNDVADGMKTISKANFNKLSEKEQTGLNWLLVEKTKLSFVLNNYKSNKTYGQKIIPIEDASLKRLLRYYIKVNGGVGEILFKNTKGEAMSRNGLTQLFLKKTKDYMGKSVGSTLFRKSYLSDKYSVFKDELQKDNLIMGHSMGVALNTYVKNEE